jgi:hypothetical protein
VSCWCQRYGNERGGGAVLLVSEVLRRCCLKHGRVGVRAKTGGRVGVVSEVSEVSGDRRVGVRAESKDERAGCRRVVGVRGIGAVLFATQARRCQRCWGSVNAGEAVSEQRAKTGGRSTAVSDIALLRRGGTQGGTRGNV